MFSSAIFCFNFIFLTSFISAEVPSYIPICGRRDPNLNECIIKSVDKLRPKLREGIPELNVPPVDPVFLKDGLPLTDSPDFKAGASNIKIYNALDFEVRGLNVDLENQRIDVRLFFKRLRLTGDYDVKAKIIVPVEGTGPIEIDNKDIESNSTMTYQLVNTKKGKQMFFSGMKNKLKIGDYKSVFTAKTGPTAKFSEAVNAVINGNRQEILDTITPHIEKAVSTKILEIANQICKNFTYDELFPDRE
ncbi:uncharacterized protein LOC123268082 [Cotesia glomerata]|uniref:Uncharacterized protein n=1 Tax=Cotesia glomerata TaxID=32391 RepID=A0AAV7J5G7_COTGL|nr:uncharacterized protein LOC123268082 [Cotesia glomerata]KAH0568190.1 hypothetical protein KQX54_019508 [Cotesia glomerata]